MEDNEERDDDLDELMNADKERSIVDAMLLPYFE